MTLRRDIVLSLLTVGAGQVSAKILSLITTVFVARMLGPEHWGIAATFVIILTILEAVSAISTDRQVVQARDGAEPDFLATAHLMMVMRGLAIATAVLSVSWPAAWIFGRPEALWAYKALALIPLIRGFAHLDVYVRQRDYRFGSTALLEILPAAVALFLGLPLAWWLGDYSAAFWLIAIRSLSPVAISHLIATSPYRWKLDWGLACRIMRFGWPLMLNGIIMYVILQGDQTIVGATYDMPTLGIYAAAFTLASVPTLIVGGLASTILLPALSAAAQDDLPFARRVAGSAQAVALSAGVLGIGLIMLGPVAIEMLYGSQYQEAAGIMSILAAAWSLRLLRATPNLAAMSRSDTINLLLSNVWRCIGLVSAVVAAILGADVRFIAGSAVLGELCGLVASCLRLTRSQRVPLSACGGPALVCASFLLAALAAEILLWESGVWLLTVIAILLVSLFIITMVTTSSGTAHELRALRDMTLKGDAREAPVMLL